MKSRDSARLPDRMVTIRELWESMNSPNPSGLDFQNTATLSVFVEEVAAHPYTFAWVIMGALVE